MDALQALGQKMASLAEALGVDMNDFKLTPDLNGEAHVIEVTFVLPELIDEEEIERFTQAIEAWETENTNGSP